MRTGNSRATAIARLARSALLKKVKKRRTRRFLVKRTRRTLNRRFRLEKVFLLDTDSLPYPLQRIGYGVGGSGVPVRHAENCRRRFEVDL